MSPATPKTRARSLAELQARMQGMFTPEGVGHAFRFKARPTDVFITPFGKCGTTWLQQIVHSLRTRGDLEFDDISRVVPWLETSTDLGIDLDAPQRGEPRAFKSHLPWGPIPKGGKYIVSLRDPKDALVSMYRFMEGWFLEPGAVAIEDFARQRYMQRKDGMDYWSHLLSWWGERDNPAVLLLAYEHMKADLPGTIERVAAFIGIPLDPALRRIVEQQASLQSMLEHKGKYDDLMMRQRSEEVANLPPGSDSAKVRKGQVGSHREELPAAVIDELDAIWRSVVTPHTGADSYAALIATLPSAEP
ncbi:MAG: sulfotransferase domain-containing protein [Gammaproteobacteria bacterium]|nr:sulfotransferase domain-containing protein [Gammaproteobacteria bacterium]